MKYLLIDTANLFFRARHVARRGSTIDEKIGLALHIIFTSIAKQWRDQSADHVVFFLDGRSWRKDIYERYKKNRQMARAALSKKEQEEDVEFWNAYHSFLEYLQEKTNCTVILAQNAEADDTIARFIDAHPKDEHLVVSSDSDLQQLVRKNVELFNGISKHVYTSKGVFNESGDHVLDKKTKKQLPAPDPEWIIFEKCIRGDASDFIFSAYPGAPMKSSKKRVGIKEAFADRNKKGYNWNNFMLQRWVDHTDKEHRVLDDYNRNRQLIDLQEQPKQIKEEIDEAIKAACVVKDTRQIGTHFLKFCGKWDLIKMTENTNNYLGFLSARYK